MCVHGNDDCITAERARQMEEHQLEIEHRKAARRARKLVGKAAIAERKGNTSRRDHMLQLARDAAMGLPEELMRDVSAAMEDLQARTASPSHRGDHVLQLQAAV
jgi:hypothetical protein